MPGNEWLDDEIAIAVYFAASNYQHSLIALLLQRRGFNRTKASVDNKLIAIRNSHLELGTGYFWDVTAAHKWASQNISNHELLELDEEDAAMICLCQPKLMNL
ncbi:hypothetical protein TESG_00555 [Trichophyton tonsurans CBS 112818]|uniref:Uncharacterized protein n=1 Tax=Trichophyton tonsurans (strain CBS 112818) TaxID=647933 RepID=F2RNT9_TRIT1|nr:hypothetical protein TESG_00555 [Trichophyton tonsurans CBS 112818]